MKHTILLILFIFGIVSTSLSNQMIIYKINGVNLITDNKISGEMYDINFNGTVSGIIFDNNEFDVIGTWSGKGQAILISIDSLYVYEVIVEE